MAFQLPLIFSLKVSGILTPVLAGLAYFAWRRDSKRALGDVSLIPWRTVSILLWASAFLTAIQVMKALPAYVAG